MPLQTTFGIGPIGRFRRLISAQRDSHLIRFDDISGMEHHQSCKCPEDAEDHRQGRIEGIEHQYLKYSIGASAVANASAIS